MAAAVNSALTGFFVITSPPCRTSALNLSQINHRLSASVFGFGFPWMLRGLAVAKLPRLPADCVRSGEKSIVNLSGLLGIGGDWASSIRSTLSVERTAVPPDGATVATAAL